MIPYLNKISDFEWEIPQSTNPLMKTDARIFANEAMFELIGSDNSLKQLINVASLPGVRGNVYVMPDVHQGYGFPIGAVAGIDYDDGVISPGGIGYDINCGVRLIRTNAKFDDIRKDLPRITKELNKNIPSGVGQGGKVKLVGKDMDRLLNKGVKWCAGEGYAMKEDLQYIESNGSMPEADASVVSQHAKKRAYDQCGTMGAGNHFVEINRVQEIFDEEAAKAYGLEKGQIVIQIHTGSRGLGHQVASDYIRSMMKNQNSFGIDLPDRELTCAPINSELGQDYYSAMAAAANFAWSNRQIITYYIRKSWKKIFSGSENQLKIVYDLAHNIAKIEDHTINNDKYRLMVHRKGATRAFPSDHHELPNQYKNIGQPVLIPGSMGTSSYVLRGLDNGMNRAFGSSCHGAGRTMSRTKAKKKINGKELFDELTAQGINIQAGSWSGLSEEAPAAYKDINQVIEIMDNNALVGKVAKLVPLGVIKG